MEDHGDQYLWYTVTVVTGQPQSLGTIELKAEVRRLLTHKVEIVNSSSNSHVYDVVIIGEGFYGNPTVTAEANSTSTYELQCLPLKEGEFKATICFINLEEGELLYEVKVKADEPVPQTVKGTCPLGTSFEHVVTLQNPSDSEAFVNSVNPNPDCF